MKVAIVASHVIQYQAPFFRLLAQEPGLVLRVVYCSPRGAQRYHDVEMCTTLRWDLDLLSGYDHLFLRNCGWGNRYWRLVNPGIVPTLLRGGYDAVIFFVGWGTVSSILGMAACWRAGIPFFLFSDSSFVPASDSLPSRLRDRAMRWLCRRATGFLVSGELNARYYEHYGADPTRFFRVPWAIDNERFETASRFAPGERDAMRTRFGVAPDQTAVIFSGKLIPRKGPLTLLEAISKMAHRDRVAVVFLGQGELRGALEEYATTHGVQVHFSGFVNQADLPKHYAAADVFVLPSFDDPRATVINEAMACGLPIVVSDRCGPVGDIARDGDNALVFHAGDTDALAAALDLLARDAGLRRQMGARSREVISGWDYRRGVEGVREAFAKSFSPPP